MPNMSYCRYENTLKDLHDCHEAMQDEDISKLSDTEATARYRLIRLCKKIAAEALQTRYD